MLEKFRDVVQFEKELRKIKKEHFQRVVDLEDKLHKLQNEQRDIHSMYKDKLKTQEADYERDILNLKHQLTLERDRISLEKETMLRGAEKEIFHKKETFLSESYDKMQDLMDREKVTLKEVLMFAMQRLPDAKHFRVDGDAKLEIPSLENGKKQK